MGGRSPMEGEFPGEKEKFCKVNILLHSPGIWNCNEDRGFLDYALPRLLLQMAAIFIITQSLHVLLKRIHFPRIVPEFLAGVILGPTILPRINLNFAKALFPPEGEVFLDGLSRIGYIFFMFLIGVKMEPSMVWKSGKKAWIIGLSSVVLPTIIVMGISEAFDQVMPLMKIPAATAVVAIQTLTPFPVIACFVIDLKIMNSELGRLALASTLISDLVSTGISTILANLRIRQIGFGTANVIHSFFLATALLLIIIFIMRPILLWIIKQTPEGKPVKGVHITSISFLVLAMAIISDNVGLQYHFGPFILGLCVPSGPPLGSTLVDRFDTFISGLLAPLVVTNCGLKIDLFEVFDLKFLTTMWFIIGVSSFTKLIVHFFLALPCKVPVKDAAALSIIGSAQGIVEMASYLNIFVNQVIDNTRRYSSIWQMDAVLCMCGLL
ncbi:unnamed protein product [Ilex paraguariensis]|uniref:Cation/H+ exchanger transmembrane domain-containing protein n=1 Tax=Ilex paraguariensis TaxID=185542 RepID=A0ABC8TX66_9AQUA